MKKEIKVRCPVCGDAIEFENNKLKEHSNKYAFNNSTVCYGSHLPIFQEKGLFESGKIMYIHPNYDLT